MPNIFTAAKVAMAYRKHAGKKDDKKVDLQSVLSGLPAGVAESAVQERNAAEEKKRKEDEDKKRAAKRSIRNALFIGAHNVDKVNRLIRDQ